MKHIRKVLAWVLCLCMILGTVPAVSAETDSACTAALTGNRGAVISCSSTPLSAEVDNNELAIVEIRGSKVRVLGKAGAVGVARLTVQTAAGYEIFDIPIGYTTFVFDGDTLTVIEGSDLNYQVTGVNAAVEEYVVGDVSYPLPETVNADGNKVYANTDAYKLLVNIAKTGGTYVFTGTANDSAICVKKAATDPAVILLAGLDMKSSFTAPITVKKESTTTATITALGGFTNTLADAAFNNADNYGDPTTDGGDGTNIEYAESAVIKGKSYSNLTLNGAGTLNLICATKNALKVGEYGSLTIDELTLNVNSAKNGISSDNTLVINGGSISVTTESGDCIRTDPDAVDASAGCAADIVINGGVFNLQAASDGIQSAQNLTINGGEFTIQAGAGYNDSSFDKDTMSCKGIKGTNPSDDETVAGTNVVTINGGSFNLNTADDAIHSDGTIVINGGEFAIQTGDDGVHAETQADFGAVNGSDCAVHLTVSTSYEGLEAMNVNINSGCYSVTASDDGINAAGGSSSGSDPSPWNPGGGGGSGSTGDYALNIKGGNVFVNCNGDGLDSNGPLNITGGRSIVWAQAPNGDNSPLDSDGTMTVKGGTVFGGGTNPMNENPSTSTSQPYVKYGSSGGGWGGGSGSTISSGRTVVVKNASSQTVFSIKAPKNINYAIYSDPSMTTSTGWSISSDSSTPTTERFWTEHQYGAYVQTQAPSCTVPGVRTATCSVCGDTQTQEIAPTGHSWSYVTIAPTETLEGYDLYTCSVCGGQYRTNFTDPTGGPNPCAEGHTWDAGVVTTQPTCTEPGVTTYTCTVCGETTTTASPSALGHDFDESTGVCSRCGEEAFKATFVCSEGVSVTFYPSQDLSTGGVANAQTVFVRNSAGTIDISGYGQLNFTVTLEDGYGVESIEVTPAGSYNAIKYPADVGVENAYRVTKINQDVTVTVNAAQGLCDHEFDENGFCIHCGVEAPKAVFVCGAGASVTAYPTQDLSTGGVENATVALARNSDSGVVDLNGNGQVNFVLNLADGYELESITAEPTGSYKNFKDNGDGSYRLTRVAATVTVTVNTVYNGPAGYTVHFSVPAGVTRPADMISVPGTGITLPAVTAPEGYEFLGWVTEDYDNVTELPANILTGSYEAPAEITLKALFTYSEGSSGTETVYELLSAAPAELAGDYVITYGTDETSANGFYLMQGTAAASAGKGIENVGNRTAFANTGATLEGTTLKNVGDSYIFVVDSLDTYYTIHSKSTGVFLGMNTNSYLSAYSSYSSSYCRWTIPAVADNFSSAKNARNGYYPYISFGAQDTGDEPYFWAGSSNSIGATGAAQSVRWWKAAEIEAGTAYYTTIIGQEHEHTPAEAVIENNVDPTCTEAGSYDRVVYCSECGEEISRETVTVPALGHTPGEPVQENVVPATCSAEGSYDEVVYCSVCNEELSREAKTIEKLAHTPAEPVIENEVPATCTVPGSYESVVYCSACGEEISRETVSVDALGHNPGEAVQENYVEPTATADGGYDTVIYCTRCNAELSREHVAIPATGPAEPVLDESIVLYNSIGIGIEIQTTFGVRKSVTDRFESWYIEVSKLDEAGNVTETKRFGAGQEGAVSEGYIREAVYTDITAKEMGVRYAASFHGFAADGSETYSNTVTNTVRDYVIGELLKTDNDDATRRLAADLLNYGAAAQVYFNFDAENLVNANLSAEAQAAMEQFADVGEAPATLENGSNGPNVYGSVSVMNRVVLSLTVRGLGTPSQVQILVKNHETGEVKATIDAVQRGSVWMADYAGFEAEDMRTAFDFVPVADGTETGTPLTWSVEGYAREARLNEDASEAELALFNALLHYIDAVTAAYGN